MTIDITQATAYEQYLPESLREKVELIGLHKALILVKFWGGIQQLYIPEKMKPEHQLAQRLGFKEARMLSEHYGGEYICVPRAVDALRAIRDDEIRGRHMRGKSARLLAPDYGLTERQVWTIIGRSDDIDDRQAELF